MLQRLIRFFEQQLTRKVPATGLALFRIGFSLVALQEVLFLFYFRHLIFDPTPYLDRASPVLHAVILAWAAVLIALLLGYRTRQAALANYLLWITFVVFTPLWQDFDGGFDQLMTGSSLLLVFLPSERRFSLDQLRWRLRYSSLNQRYQPEQTVSPLAYSVPVFLSLGLVYLDSGLHKLSSEFWRNGMGGWLPPTHPYYQSPLDLSAVLNHKTLQQLIGYAVMGFQLGFIFLFWRKAFRIPILILGVGFHVGIILALNVYPFGFAMLVHYLLEVPFRAWHGLGRVIRVRQPTLTVFYDQQCPLCNRTVIILEHFDIRHAVAFKGLQSYRTSYPLLSQISETDLLRDLYALDPQGQISQGVDTYIKILLATGYGAPIGWLLRVPGIYHLAKARYRAIADNRIRKDCGPDCALDAMPEFEDERPFSGFFKRHTRTDRATATRIAKVLVVLLVLQLNSTIHYALLYRWAGSQTKDPALVVLDQASDALINMSHTLFGISPHALYMHDHFDDYNRIVAITYKNPDGIETWLPFVNTEGRLLSPFWGRIQSMWANVAITSHMSPDRLEKFTRKVTAFMAPDLGIPLEGAEFLIKVKSVEAPTDWVFDLRHLNSQGAWSTLGTLKWEAGLAHLHLQPHALDPVGENADRHH